MFAYTAHLIPKKFEALIDSIYHIQSNSESLNRSVLPDGKVDVAIVLKDVRNSINSMFTQTEGVYVQINNGKPKNVEIVQGSEIIGIRFFPHTFFRFFGIPAAEIGDDIHNLNSFIPINEDLIEQLKAQKTIQSKFICIEYWLLMFLEKTQHYYAFEQEIAHQITQNHTVQTLNWLKIDSSKYKRVQRYFTKIVGSSPKQYQKQLRLDTLHQKLLILNPDDVKWFDVVYELGFYDQSHLSKEIKSLMQMTPSEFLHAKNEFI
jgi:AraC-like DNA-binding protein